MLRWDLRSIVLQLTYLCFIQDGTINYLNLPAITDGLRFLSAYLPFLPLRLNILTHYLIQSLDEIRHEASNTPVVRILSRAPSRRLRSVGEQGDTGSVVSLIFLSVSGAPPRGLNFYPAKGFID